MSKEPQSSSWKSTTGKPDIISYNPDSFGSTIKKKGCGFPFFLMVVLVLACCYGVWRSEVNAFVDNVVRETQGLVEAVLSDSHPEPDPAPAPDPEPASDPDPEPDPAPETPAATTSSLSSLFQEIDSQRNQG